ARTLHPPLDRADPVLQAENTQRTTIPLSNRYLNPYCASPITPPTYGVCVRTTPVTDQPEQQSGRT
ncbi:MAG: hypothetical protein ABGZ23_23190, partial [Fuerstiella sp.]